MTGRDTLASLVADPRPFLGDPDPLLRRLAASACADHGDDTTRERLEGMVRDDPVPVVRRECAETLGALASPASLATLVAATEDPEVGVREAAVTALGEIGDPVVVPRLLALAGGDDDVLVREAAVAAAGAVGDETAVPTLLELVAAGPPQVRRRCVVALSVFDGPEVEAAIRSATKDRNPMVREAAHMVTGNRGE